MSVPATVTSPNKGIYYGWVVVASGFIIMGVCLAIQSAFGIFIVPLQETFGWSRATTAWTMTIQLMVFALCLVPVGWWLDRFNTRAMYTIAAFLVGTPLVLSSQISQPWQLYLLQGVLLGMGLSLCGPVILGVIARWFPSRRGMALGIASAGTGFGMLVGAPLTGWLIESYGWPTSFVALGVACFIILLICASFLKSSPSPAVNGDASAARPASGDQPAEPPVGKTLRQALRTEALLLILVAQAFAVFTTRMTIVHIAPHAIDIGIAPSVAAMAVGTIGAFSTLGRLVMGFFQDRLGPRRSMIMCLSAQAAGMAALPFIRSEALVFIFAMLFGFTWGGDVPQIPALTARWFGLSSLAMIYGLVMAVGNLAGAVGPAMAGYVFDLTGSYTAVFLASAAGLLVAVYCIWRLRPGR